MKQEIKSKKHIPIEDSLHEELKSYCRERGLILKSLVEKLIKDKLEKDGIRLSTPEERH
jgi:hypothetical protein